MRITPHIPGLPSDSKSSFLYYFLYIKRVATVFLSFKKGSLDQKGGTLLLHAVYFSPMGKNKILLSATKIVLLVKRILILNRLSIQLHEEFTLWVKDCFTKKGRCSLDGKGKGDVFSPSTRQYLKMKGQKAVNRVDACYFATTRLVKACFRWTGALLDLIEIKLLKDVTEYDALTRFPAHFRGTIKELELMEQNHEQLVQTLEKSYPVLAKIGLGKLAKEITGKVKKLRPTAHATSKTARKAQNFFNSLKELTKSGFTAFALPTMGWILGKKLYPQKTLPLETIYDHAAT